MQTFDKDGHPLPPYRGGNHLISMRAPVHWYLRRVVEKGKYRHETHVKELMVMLIDKFFGDEEFSTFDAMKLLNLDCIVNREADFVLEELELMIADAILGHFPRLGAELPKNFYQFNEMDLLIDVPPDYEDQRGYFF
jgi:hypothetical protein